MSSAAYSGPIRHVVVVMLARRSYDEVLGMPRAPGAARSDGFPVTAYLARQFAVCDRWFASSPAGGAANPLFAHCAADADGRTATLEPNVFSALDAVRGVRSGDANWKVYFHDDSLVGRALPYAARCWSDPQNANLANYDEVDFPPGTSNALVHPTTTFLQDVAQNRLPAYAFVEPRRGPLPATISVATGRRTTHAADPFADEALVCEVYLALRTSAYWEHSLLIVLSGEAEPSARDAAPPSGWGARVPAVVVSPYAEPGSVLRADTPFEHASILKTAWECFALAGTGAQLNARAAAAPSLLGRLAAQVVNRPAPGIDFDDLLAAGVR